jgi:hypothetical protein
VKFLRQFAAVVLVVAVIVGLGMLWAHASGGTGGIGPGDSLRRAPSPQAVQRMDEIRAGVIPAQPDDGFHLADTQNLIRTCEIEAALAAVVITVGVVRRRQRRARRRAAAEVSSI